MPGEAAWTQPNTNYPGFINISRSETPGHLRVLLRTPHQSNVSTLDIPIEAYDQLIAGAAQVRQAVESELGAHVAQGFTGKAPEPYDGKPYPTPNDPLCQRTDPSLPDDHPDNEGYYAKPREPYRSNGASAGDPLAQRAAELDTAIAAARDDDDNKFFDPRTDTQG